MQEGVIKESTILKMLLANVFAFHNTSRHPDNQTYIEASQHSVALQHTITLAMDCFSHVLQQSKFAVSTRKTRNVTFSDEQRNKDKEGDKQNQQQNETKMNPMYMAISVFCTWLTTHPDFLKCTDEFPVWLRLRELVVEVSNQVLAINDKEDVKNDLEKSSAPLPEDIECQGFLPLSEVLNGIDFTIEPIKEGVECREEPKSSNLVFYYDWTDN